MLSHLWIRKQEKFVPIGSGRGENKAVFKGHNMAIELDRAAGSTMKPIFDYGPAN